MNKVSRDVYGDFYLGFEEKSFLKLVFLMIFSLGFYFINWIYLMNVKFKKYDVPYSPNPNWGLKFMFLVPFVWLISLGVLKNYILVGQKHILFWVDVVGWIIIMIMMLEYLYRFCKCFANFTDTNAFIWYLFLWVGFFPLVLVPFSKWFFLPLLIFPLFTVPFMQLELNYNYRKYFGS